MAAATSSRRSLRRPAATTLAPSRPSASAQARPIPLDAPVTRMVLRVKRRRGSVMAAKLVVNLPRGKLLTGFSTQSLQQSARAVGQGSLRGELDRPAALRRGLVRATELGHDARPRQRETRVG